MKIFSFIGSAVASLSMCTVDAAGCPQLEANKNIALALLDSLYNDHDPSAIDKYIVSDYKQHNPTLPDGSAVLKDIASTFTDETKAEFGAVVAEGDLVFVDVRYSGVPGYNTSIVAEVFRVENGKLTEHWGHVQTEVSTSQTASGRPVFPVESKAATDANAPASSGDACTQDPQVEANKNTAQALLDGIFNQRNTSAVDAYISGPYLQHNSNVADGADALKGIIGALDTNSKVEFGAIVGAGDLVWVNGRYSGILGQPASVSVDIFRFEDGKVVEHWGRPQTEVPASQTQSGRPMFPVTC